LYGNFGDTRRRLFIFGIETLEMIVDKLGIVPVPPPRDVSAAPAPEFMRQLRRVTRRANICYIADVRSKYLQEVEPCD